MKLFLAATKANVGKTTSSIGLMALAAEKFNKLGYIKPVGQRVENYEGISADEDSVLIREHFSLKDNLEDMSPVTLPHGFTEKYINAPDPHKIEDKILSAYKRISAWKDFVLVEGTGHAGVGAVVDFSNARVAKLLDAKVLLVANGGVGKPIDEIVLNKALFDLMGVPVIGVILNRVRDDKFEKIKDIAGKGLERLGVPLLGSIPHRLNLTYPRMVHILEELKGKLISGKNSLENIVKNMIIGALPPHEILDRLEDYGLLITPGNRDDLILAAISNSSLFKGREREKRVTGIVLTCGLKPHPNIMTMLSETDLPVILVKEDTFTTATHIGNLIVKTRKNDQEKISEVIELFQEYVDFDRILSLLAK